jgi:hypothetical protein
MPKSRYVSPKPKYQTTPHHHSQPPKDSKAVFEWEKFEPLSDFSDASMASVFKRISEDIIERPYHYDPHKAFDASGKQVGYAFSKAGNSGPPAKIPGVAVYKQNHGTGHAIRQMVYTDALIDKIAQEGNTKGKDIAQKVNANPEIKSILKLAAYCKRIGRTFDHEHDDPGHTTIYSQRSADMFAKMAGELGYNPDLIKAVSEGMLEPTPKPTSLTGKDIGGIKDTDLKNFSESVLMAAHMADLARLFTVRRNYIETSLKHLFEPAKLPLVSTQLVEMACKANIMTGNPVVAQESGVQHKTAPIDGKKLVHVVTHIDETIGDLAKLKLTTPSASVKASPVNLGNPQPTAKSAKQPFLMPGNNKVESVEIKDGVYTIRGKNNSEQPRFITIDAEGKVKGYNGAELGYVEKKMRDNMKAICEHFNVPPPPTVAVTVSKKVEPSAFVLKDSHGNNFVDSIQVKDGVYTVKGRNASGVTRSITIDSEGNITGYNGSKDLGVVGRQMLANKEAIFKHFNVALPPVKQERQAKVSSETPISHTLHQTKVSSEAPIGTMTSEKKKEAPKATQETAQKAEVSEDHACGCFDAIISALKKFGESIQHAFEAMKEFVLGAENENKGPKI